MITGTRFRLTAEINRQAKLSQELTRVQTEISTNKKVQAPSDDPASAALLAEIRRSEGDRAAWASNVSSAIALSDRASSELAGLSSTLNRVNELVLSASSSTTSPADRAVIAAELREIALDVGNVAGKTDTRGQALFPRGTPIAVPIGRDITTPVSQSYETVFGSVPTDDGPQSIVDIINAAATAIEEPDEAIRTAARATSIKKIGQSMAHVIGVLGTQGVLGARLEAAQEQLEDNKLVLSSERSQLESVDLIESTLRLNALKLSLDAAQSSFITLNRQTLFSKLA